MSFRGSGGRREDGGRQHQCEAGPFAGLAAYLDLPAVLFHDLLDDRQADSGARYPLLFGFFGAVKLMKDLLHFLGVHPDALVLDGDADMAIPSAGSHCNFGPLGRVLHGIS
jgi:hypothetical protein